MKRPRRLQDLLPTKVLYLWEKYRLRRIELIDQEDLAKKPEIPRDTAKKPEIPMHGSFAAAHQRQLDKQRRRGNK